MSHNQVAARAVLWSIVLNAGLAVVKVTAGILGHSYALIADGIESVNDIFASLMVWVGLKVAEKPPDDDHPYGHGRAEQLAGLFSALSLLAAGGTIAWQSVHNIMHRHTSPEWFTLPILVVVIIVKEGLSRYAMRKSDETTSTALKGDAWHHRADAITSGAALLGISVALLGGDGYEMADDVAALVGCFIIFLNGFFMLKTALHENMDGAATEELYQEARDIGATVPGVKMIEKLRMKKSGLGYHMDIHVQVEGSLSVAEGHRIGHDVQDALKASDRRFLDIIVHVEPFGHAD
ncbi:cation diffusion facilitator family transporter [Prosthecobacter debontii]|uniref:Cation diffusion facilitator family transporter n=1 Tax=Prosthecobacter debontii TaxID=48467 RepID=A0A1T4YFV0_9BACT|nr:cation diffusion facilitator family transporter [Prosthecobacter debontii]SKB00644.1 cation diffusion facilitator family transporter [Prosthecobacter debontii]